MQAIRSSEDHPSWSDRPMSAHRREIIMNTLSHHTLSTLFVFLLLNLSAVSFLASP